MRNETFRNLSNELLDQLSVTNKKIQSCRMRKDDFESISQDFKHSENILKEMELEGLNQIKNIAEIKQEIQMHRIDLRDLKIRFSKLISSRTHLTGSPPELKDYILEFTESARCNDSNADHSFFSGNLKLVEGKRNLFDVENTTIQMQKTVYHQNIQIDNMNTVLKTALKDVDHSEDLIKQISKRRNFADYAILFLFVMIVILFIYSVSSKVTAIFS